MLLSRRASSLSPVSGEVAVLDEQAPYFSALRTSAELRRVPSSPVAIGIKRTVDIAGAVVGLIVLPPVLLVIALAIWLDDRGPIVYRQRRVGHRGKIFRIVKFRTMHVGADELRDELRAQNEIDGAAFKITDDPRITRVGGVLRRFSLDELPQLWNVLVGDMSLVGPRPHTLDDVERYADWHYERLAAKPGMTGLWQVRGRRDSQFDRWVEQDIEYIQHWSFWLDVVILWGTVGAVLNANGR